jgi:hypothetical protein
MISARRLFRLSLVLSLIFLPSIVWADSVVINHGSVFLSYQDKLDKIPFALTGPNNTSISGHTFSLYAFSLSFHRGPFSINHPSIGASCGLDTPDGEAFMNSSVKINGTNYSGQKPQINFGFKTEKFKLDPTDASQLLVSLPFTCTIHLSLNDHINPIPGTTPFHAKLTGEGTVYALLTRDNFGFFFMNDIEYRFGDITSGVSIKPVPTPEPATMILLGSGLLGVAMRARRKKKNTSRE